MSNVMPKSKRLKSQLQSKTSWELGRDLFGADRSPPEARNVSGRVKDLIRAKVRACAVPGAALRHRRTSTGWAAGASGSSWP